MPRLKPKANGKKPVAKAASKKVAEDSDTEDIDTLRESLGENLQKMRRLGYNLEPRYKGSFEQLEQELEAWKINHASLERELEKVRFATGLSQREVEVVKKTLTDTTAYKDDEIARLKRDNKADNKKYTEQIKELNRIQQNLVSEVEEYKLEIKDVTRRLSEANMGVVELNHKIKNLQRQNKTLQTSLTKAVTKLDKQIATKSKHEIELAKLKLSQEEAKAKKAIVSKTANAEKSQVEHKQKKEIMEMRSNIKLVEKEAAVKQKEQARKQQETEQNDRVKVASGFMKHTVSGNGGSFLDMAKNNNVSTSMILDHIMQILY